MTYRERRFWAAIALIVGLLCFVEARAAEPPPRPEPTAPADGFPDCPTAIQLRPGEPFIPPAWLMDEDGVVQCGAILEPYTSFADLLNIETEYNRLRGLYRIDTLKLELDYEHYKARALNAEAKLKEPPPVWERPGVNRVVGAAEVLVVGAVVAYGLNGLN